MVIHEQDKLVSAALRLLVAGKGVDFASHVECEGIT